MKILRVDRSIRWALALLCLAPIAPTTEAQPDDSTRVWVGATIHVGTGAVLEDAALVVKGGKIVALGAAASLTIPEGAERVDARGKVIIPGLVDTHSHLGVGSRPSVASHWDVNEMTGPVQSSLRAIDAINPRDPGIQMALAGGVTTANIMPGSGNVIGGQTAYVKYRGQTVEEMLIQTPRTLGGLKMANGENPKRAYGSKGKEPGTRMKIAALQRAEFLKAKEYQQKWDSYRAKLGEGKEATPPEVQLGLEPLVQVLQKKRTVHFHSHRADDIRTVLRLADEFGFDLVLQHGTESFKVTAEIAQRKVPVSLTILDSAGGKAEVVDAIEECARELHQAGIKVVINTDDPVTESRFFLRTAAIAVRGGLPENEALQAVTLHAAEALKLDDRLGSLEPGKDADFVVLSGPPFSVWTRVLETYIEGAKMFDQADDLQRRYATGGFNLPDGAAAPRFDAPIPPASTLPPPQAAKPISIDALGAEYRIFGRKVHTISRGTITNGVLHIKEGKIESIHEHGEAALPQDLPIVAVDSVTPGLIDAFSTVPLTGEYNIAADQDADEKSDPNQADLRVLDAFNPREPLLHFLLSQGVTTLHACPGRENVLAGLSGVFRTHGQTADEMVVRFPQALIVNLGESPKTAYPERMPGTRMGTAGLLRQALAAAANYRQKVKAAKSPEEVDQNPKHEALLQAVDQKIDTFLLAQRADDLVTAIRLARDYNLRGVLGLAAEAYLVPEAIARAKMPVVVHPLMQRVGGMETFNSFLGMPAVLAEKGIRVAIGSAFEGYVPKTRVVRHEAAIAMVNGLGFERALSAITLDAARILRIDDRYGSIELGKIADLVLYNGHPFEHSTQVLAVIAEGKVVYDRATRPKGPLAARGLHPAEPACCLDFFH